ncbi:Hsp33 family molecular chaperone HslO [Pacificimonas sp. WHA3]|uniref:Hsp33 family molecular chaperone HslO n=1 Tax=Pacificimonas pallii TaxID=2827236 RepID=A0ABS6SHG6_9SPHN|nr:Hsp33 family molecular chaperone HslO [Pacificimonas pallii]MBV7257859.1 Hsp33 family molecular chaperone HslO [Pacificimonas pallii]
MTSTTQRTPQSAAAIHAPSPEDNRVMGFTIPLRAGRGRVMRLGDTLGVILSAHDYPAPVAKALGETLVLTALIGSALKGDGGQTTVQAKAENGAIGLIVCDYRAGELRGYCGFDADRVAALPQGADLPALFGEGYLAVTLEPENAEERFQGIVPLEGENLCAAFTQYFESSEQIPTVLRAAVRRDENGAWHAGGLMVQHLPRGEDGQTRLHVEDTMAAADEDWAHLNALAATVTADELTDPDLKLEELTWRLFNQDEVRTLPATPLSRGCRCSAQHIAGRLGTLPEEHRAELRDEDGMVNVDCEFCARKFTVAI